MTSSYASIHLVPVGSDVVFAARTGPGEAEPWVSDGTSTGTVRLGDVFPGTTGSFPQLFNVVGSHVLAETGAVHGEH